MKAVFNPDHHFHTPLHEFSHGSLVAAHEIPQRAEIVRDQFLSAGLGPLLEPRSFDRSKLLAVHTPGLIDLLENGFKEWQEAHGHNPHIFPSSWPLHISSPLKVPQSIDGRLSYYCADTVTPLTATTWRAVQGSAFTSLTAADLILGGETSAFAICRPPGHHAARNTYGGFCFLNNIAIAAEHFSSQGISKIAVLDIDYHHGNGTQDIFYHRKDVLTVSIHGDPAFDYPFFSGYSDEIGSEDGLGFNCNFPLPLGSDWAFYKQHLDIALKKIAQYRPEQMIIALGVDTFQGDPISHFRIQSDDYKRIGRDIASLKCPTLFVLEGGYAVEELGENVVNVLIGFLDARG